MKKETKWLNNPWSISIGTATFSLFLTILYDLVKSKPILSSIGQIISWVIKVIVSILTFDIKVYWILIFLIVIVLVLFLFVTNSKPENSKPVFINYKTEKFKKLRWSWSWKYNTKQNAWNVSDLTAHCPKCDTTMLDSDSGIYGLRYECPRCNYVISGGDYEFKDRIETLILDNLRRQENN